MQSLEVSGAVRPVYGSLGVKRLRPEMSKSESVVKLSKETVAVD